MTGVGPGVGRSIAVGFARHGVDVVLAARQQSRLESVAEEIRRLGREPVAIPTDITQPIACQELVRSAVERFGGVDFLVQNAHHEGDWTPVAEADVDSWRSIFDVNLYGALYLVKAAVPAMQSRGGGAIVLVNSGSLVSTPPALGAYTASKAALAGMARALAVEVGRRRGREHLACRQVAGRRPGSHPRGMAGEAQGLAPTAVHADSGPMCRHRALLLLGSGRRGDRPTPEREQRPVDNLSQHLDVSEV